MENYAFTKTSDLDLEIIIDVKSDDMAQFGIIGLTGIDFSGWNGLLWMDDKMVGSFSKKSKVGLFTEGAATSVFVDNTLVDFIDVSSNLFSGIYFDGIHKDDYRYNIYDDGYEVDCLGTDWSGGELATGDIAWYGKDSSVEVFDVRIENQSELGVSGFSQSIDIVGGSGILQYEFSSVDLFGEVLFDVVMDTDAGEYRTRCSWYKDFVPTYENLTITVGEWAEITAGDGKGEYFASYIIKNTTRTTIEFNPYLEKILGANDSSGWYPATGEATGWFDFEYNGKTFVDGDFTGILYAVDDNTINETRVFEDGLYFVPTGEKIIVIEVNGKAWIEDEYFYGVFEYSGFFESIDGSWNVNVSDVTGVPDVAISEDGITTITPLDTDIFTGDAEHFENVTGNHVGELEIFVDDYILVNEGDSIFEQTWELEISGVKCVENGYFIHDTSINSGNLTVELGPFEEVDGYLRLYDRFLGANRYIMNFNAGRTSLEVEKYI